MKTLSLVCAQTEASDPPPRLLRTLVTLVLTAIFLDGGCVLSRKSFELKLSGPLVVQDQWIEIRPQQSFTAERDRQFIVLELEPPFSYDFYRQGRGPNAGEGILMPDKGVLNPEIKVVDEQGNNLDLVYRGARRTFWPAYGLPYPQEFPKDPKYKHVRLRSEQPISV